MSLSNHKVILMLRILKGILASFIESFLVLYFLDLSDRNILPFGIYRLVSVFFIFITIFLLRNKAKTKHRVNLLRIGIILDFIYFLTIIFLKENIINYAYIIGILYGLAEGFYYSVFNTFESDGISNKERAKYNGIYMSLKSGMTIIFPIIFGSLIATTGFLKSIILVLIIVGIRIIISFHFKDKNIPKNKKVNLKEYFKKIKNNKYITQMYKINFFNGLTYSEGAFSNIVTIYIIKVFSDSFSLGIFTSIFSLISCFLGILFAKKINKEKYPNIIQISMIITILSLIVMILKCNAITIILFKFFQTISKVLVDLINNTSQSNISNLDLIKKEYKVEYYLGHEIVLFIGRTISHSLFILMAFIDVIYIIPVFIVFLILLMLNSIKLQKELNGGKICE